MIGYTATINALRLYIINKKLDMFGDTINHILSLQSKQLEYLASISEDIQNLKEGPFFSAKIFLKDATKVYRTPQEQKELLKEAKSKFIDALGILEAKSNKKYEDYYQVIIVKFYIAFCWVMLDKRYDAKDWLDNGINALNKCLNTLNNEKGIVENILKEIPTKIVDKRKGLFESGLRGTVLGLVDIVTDNHDGKGGVLTGKMTYEMNENKSKELNDKIEAAKELLNFLSEVKYLIAS